MPQKTTLIHLVSHPVQYFTPLYEQLAAESDMDFRVLYCCKRGLESTKDVEFGVSVKWDVPLLDNYRYTFLHNYARRESLNSFLGLLNLGVVKELANAPKHSVVWIHGWNYATHLLALFTAKFFGHQVYIRGDNAAMLENKRPNSLKKRFKKLWLGSFIFPFVDKFLAVGKQNKAFFELMGVPQHKIAKTPHAIDNQRFRNFFSKEKDNKVALRQSLGISLSKKVIIVSGKYIDIKRPFDVLNALTRLPNRDNVFVLFVGEGNLRADMEQFIKENKLTENVRLTGFVNQSKMPMYYAASDVYLMASRSETWGLSTNEAMCFGLPVILSDMVGCAYDLVEGNGFMYPSGDVDALSKRIQNILEQPDTDFQAMSQRSLDIISKYSYEQIIDSIKSINSNSYQIAPSGA
jgi:glycosyltransferase involved in cell wall biosynthesis